MMMQCDAAEGMRLLARTGVKAQCIVTSPPYWRMRNYDARTRLSAYKPPRRGAELGCEGDAAAYVRALADVFGRAADAHYLAARGSLFVNIGDRRNADCTLADTAFEFAHAMKRRGWALQEAVVLVKANPKPFMARHGRCALAHEYLLWFSRGAAIDFYPTRACEPSASPAGAVRRNGRAGATFVSTGRRRLRSVWALPQTNRGRSGHPATFHTDVPVRCVLMTTRRGELVVDPFCGSCTTQYVAMALGRMALGFDIRDWTTAEAPLHAQK